MSERPIYNYAKLRGRIVEKCGTIRECSHRTGIREEQFTNAFKGRRTFTQPEISVMCKVLEIEDEDLAAYFFAT